MSIPHFLIIPSLSASIHTVVQPSTWFFQELFFFSYFLKIFISLFSHSGSSLLLRLCSSWGGQVLLSSCSMLASRCVGFSCGTRALGCVLAQQLWHTDSTAPRHTGSSWTRNRTHVSCIGRQVLYHRTTREARSGTLFFFVFPSWNPGPIKHQLPFFLPHPRSLATALLLFSCVYEFDCPKTDLNL